MALSPLYWLAERFGPTRQGAIRLGLVAHRQMVAALRWAVQNPPQPAETNPRILDVPRIRAIAEERARA